MKIEFYPFNRLVARYTIQLIIMMVYSRVIPICTIIQPHREPPPSPSSCSSSSLQCYSLTLLVLYEMWPGMRLFQLPTWTDRKLSTLFKIWLWLRRTFHRLSIHKFTILYSTALVRYHNAIIFFLVFLIDFSPYLDDGILFIYFIYFNIFKFIVYIDKVQWF